MLGQVSSQYNHKFIESIKIGDLSMRTHNIAIDYVNKPELFEVTNCPPVGCLTTPTLLTGRGLLRVYLAIVGPQSEEYHNNVPLSYRKANDVLEAISNIIKSLQKELG